jgi:hypothetical protein
MKSSTAARAISIDHEFKAADSNICCSRVFCRRRISKTDTD